LLSAETERLSSHITVGNLLVADAMVALQSEQRVSPASTCMLERENMGQ
jgi:hypothetical protein